ncbi:short chain enoyl-CoA hydratase [Brevibacterium sanguinis]|uniref:Short chain enoyl-CoA hydratase n=2 Tax=Brevibacterium TaxID=1696 RepID=A0ABX9GUI8_9MICO|nr:MULTISPECIES: enoyl-CoA hydratase-related protein [Brevibacterium]RBP68098.1 short chain enoyl-CoA hydratase [Brevibacterium sanguinis]RBP74485.1 short chain enoyl-CoA hydratase [Brevibacterium celere]
MEFTTIATEIRGAAGHITLNRPEALNALNREMMAEVCHAAHEMDTDDAVSVIIIRGSAKAFAAGADIKEMADLSFADAHRMDLFAGWDSLTRVRTPIVAAVSGYALGGGCELAMMCDLIIATDTAKFGQPEIRLGIIPGMGGTQRLTRAIGKAQAMDMILTGRMMSAAEAKDCGLVARVVPEDDFDAEIDSFVEDIAARSLIASRMAKEAVNFAYESTLSEGLRLERRLVQSTFATEDQKEGMAAFIEKREASFVNR